MPIHPNLKPLMKLLWSVILILTFTRLQGVHAADADSIITTIPAPAAQTVLAQFPRAQIKAADREPLRQFPDKHAATLALLADGTPLQVIAQDDEGRWVYARVEGGVQEGWVAVPSITNLDDLSGLPIQTISAEDILNNLDYWNFTPAMQGVFALGQTLGNRPDYFSKVGDSITVSRAYLYPFSYNVYNLTERYLYLQTALDYFNIAEEHPKTAFREPSRAAKGGWTTDNVLAEDYYYLCQMGDTRLSCEYRISQPASALIMIGTNDAVIMDADHYAKNLRKIIETSFAMGVIPVISTIPAQPRNEVRVNRFNLIIVQVAQEYNIPLWNYWHAMEQLPNRGLSFDGVHPSAPPNEAGTTLFTDENLQYGYTLRNLMALHVLDLLLFDVMYAS